MGKAGDKALKRLGWRRRLAVYLCGAFVHGAMLALIIAGAAVGIVRLWQMAMQDERFRIDGETLALAGSIKECPESVTELEHLARMVNGRSLLEPRLLSDIEDAYGGSMWVRRITGMRRLFPNRVEVEFILRTPMAQVRHGNRYWLVDSEAVLLPAAASREPFQGLPVVDAATAGIIADPPKPGHAWSDPGVTGALGIMRAFWASPLAQVLPVSRVSVNGGVFKDKEKREQKRRPRFEVETASGSIVRWGTFNEGDMDGELTSGEKLWQLQELVRREEALRPGVCFDIRTKLPGYSLIGGEIEA